ncbi:TPA: AraC family transcriptional regulator [Acinetobacter baumannii]|uniref:Transcriptional regulator, AraC family n=6 Tax=Acinetobacter baumannii TaxID=470 RepID=D0C7L1_ACIB2|nr:AraC family transcriptional regulator [Acinetobacter baumannii]EEX04976.1 transcriptional regulator, AraC family [Acinetobacter baumannii ATCC 19606 = CIP 70.34 = JCM 6841]EHU1480653.1 AraC family transcriptional regulator [Acinetobacter baumannii]EHU2105871.1 AraC family transcriptional regulator [Acinetobacter baumannii]EHU2108656.1 AraC family transcriptional regulator [Acinetobacter baumannii]EHU2701044.1 AraC family transcriptional regulator [Acinetobacter baumannii]
MIDHVNMDALSKFFDDIHLNKSEYIYIKAQGEWAFKTQDQSALLAYIVLTGSVYIQLNVSEKITARAGDIILIPSGKAHHATDSKATASKLVDPVDITPLFNGHRHDPIELGSSTSENTLLLCLRCQVDTYMAGPLINALPSIMHIQHENQATPPEWLQIGLYFLAVETQKIQPGHDKIIDHLVSILLIECIRDHIQQMSDQQNWLGALTHPELSNALSAIHSQPEISWTVETLAEQCCMSRSKFANLFNSIIGEPPLTYLQHYRFRLASQYLRTSNLSIQQISNKVGYSSETAFSQAFKRVFDLSPKQYRQNYIGTNLEE